MNWAMVPATSSDRPWQVRRGSVAGLRHLSVEPLLVAHNDQRAWRNDIQHRGLSLL